MVERINPFQVVTVPVASVQKLFDAGGVDAALEPSTQKVVLVNIDDTNYIEVGYYTDHDGTAPTTGNMDKILPNQAREFAAPQNDLKGLYVKANVADAKLAIWSFSRPVGG